MKEDRFTGCLLGLGVGDALGGPLEFLSASQARIKHGVVREMIGGGWLGLRPGQTTDDTAMALALAGSLASRGKYDIADATARYVDWLRTGPPDVGNTVKSSLSLIESGVSIEEASSMTHENLGGMSAGNGALMRCAPIALAYPCDPDGAARAARIDASITHHDPLAGECSAALCLMIIEAFGPEKDKTALIEAARKRLGTAAARALPGVQGKTERDLRPSGFAPDTLECAAWAFLRGKTFEECLVAAVNLGGDADTIGAVCGALCGAWYGASKIPARWLEPLDRKPELEAAGKKLFENSRTRPCSN